MGLSCWRVASTTIAQATTCWEQHVQNAVKALMSLLLEHTQHNKRAALSEHSSPHSSTSNICAPLHTQIGIGYHIICN